MVFCSYDIHTYNKTHLTQHCSLSLSLFFFLVVVVLSTIQDRRLSRPGQRARQANPRAFPPLLVPREKKNHSFGSRCRQGDTAYDKSIPPVKSAGNGAATRASVLVHICPVNDVRSNSSSCALVGRCARRTNRYCE